MTCEWSGQGKQYVNPSGAQLFTALYNFRISFLFSSLRSILLFLLWFLLAIFYFIFESYFSSFQKQQISLIQQIMLPPSCTLLTFLAVQASSKSLTPVCGVYNVLKGQVLFISLCIFVYNLGNQCVFWISLFTVKQQTARILFVSRLSHTLLYELQPPIAWLMSIISKTMKMSKSKLCAHKQCCVKVEGMRLSGKVLVWFMSMDVRAVLWIFCSEPPHFFHIGTHLSQLLDFQHLLVSINIDWWRGFWVKLW